MTKISNWTRIEAPTQHDVKWLKEELGIDQRHIEDALDKNMMPRLEKSGSNIYMYTRCPIQSGKELSTQPVLFVFSPKTLATFSAKRIPLFDNYKDDVLGVDTTDRINLGLSLFYEVSKEYSKLINQTGRKIEAIRQRLRGQTINNNDFVEFVVIEGELNEFSTVMHSTAITLKSMADHGHTKDFTPYLDTVKHLVTLNQQSIDSCELYEKAIAGIRDAYSTLSSNRLNQTMKVLTVATLFVALPTSLYSMYGMNVVLPFQNEPWAFVLLLMISFCIPLAVFVGIKRSRLL